MTPAELAAFAAATSESPDRVPVRPDLADLDPYGAPQLDVPVRLNTNETADPPPAAYLAEVARRMGSLELNRYPDRPHRELRERLGERHGLDGSRVWAANGSNEILHQLLLAYGGPSRRAVSFRPGYSMYRVLCQVGMTPLVEIDLDADFSLGPAAIAGAVGKRPDVLFVANPNNPTGMSVPLRSVEALHAGTRGLVVVDEAYVDFGGETAASLLDRLPRLVVARTFSKAFRLAGLRLGYLLAHEWVIDDIRRVRLPYHLDAVKQVAGITALDMADDFLEHVDRVAAERERVRGRMEALDGIEVFPSDANFLLFRVADATAVFDGLLADGVLVRDFSSLPRLEGCLRVTIGTVAENEAFLAALTRVLS